MVDEVKILPTEELAKQHINKQKLSFWERLTEAVHVSLSLIPQVEKKENYEEIIGNVVEDEFNRIVNEDIRDRHARKQKRKRRAMNKIARRSRKINYGILNNRSKRWKKET